VLKSSLSMQTAPHAIPAFSIQGLFIAAIPQQLSASTINGSMESSDPIGMHTGPSVLRTKNCVVYGNVHDLPPGLIGAFDVAILGQFLVHNRSGIDVLEAVARTTKDAMIITEGVWPVKEPGAKLIGSAARPDDFYSNWLYSPTLL
jgi:hypothetical protein